MTDRAVELVERVARAIRDQLSGKWPLSVADEFPTSIEAAQAAIAAIQGDHPTPKMDRVRGYKTFTDGMEAAAQICGSLAETTYDDTDAFEAATGCEAAIMQVVREQRKEQEDWEADNGIAVGLLSNPRPSDVLFAEACSVVQHEGDYRAAWFKMCEALGKRGVEAVDAELAKICEWLRETAPQYGHEAIAAAIEHRGYSHEAR